MKPCLALFLASLLVLLSGCTAVGRTDPASDSAVLVLEGSGTVVYADDAESTLTAEQERLLLSFFDCWYQSLAQLEAEDLSEFFCDSHQADYSAAALDLQVGIRQAQPLDYTLTGYSFVLEVESVAENEDGSIRVRLSEDSVQNFAALPGVDSKRFDTSHTFVLQQEGDGWLIRSHSQFDPLVSTLLYAYMEEYADGQWDPERFRGLDFTQDYIDAVPGYLEQVVEQAELRQQQAAEETTAQAAEEPYDREAAVAYADQWIEERSGDWADYTGSGGNCQNYASQVLYAGGIPMDIQGDYIWKWYDDTVSNRGVAWGRSSSWSGVKQFIDYAAGNTGYGLAAEVDAPYDTGEPGDLIHMGVDSDWRHTVVITQPVSDGSGQVVDYLVDSNTANLQDYPASLYGYTDQILVHSLGWNQN